MAEKNNATCSICGKPYHMCLSCKDTINLSPWKIHTCTSEHYKVFQIIRGFSTGVYTKEEAKVKLNNVDLHDLESFREHIKVLIKDILKEKKVNLETVNTTTVSQKRNYKKVKVDEKLENVAKDNVVEVE